MRALITGGSSGIGWAMAEELLRRGYDLVLVSRTEGRIDELRKRHPEREIRFLSHDLTRREECFLLLQETEGIDFDLFLNNAGYGDIGRFDETSLEKEIDIVGINDVATLILGKTFLLRFRKRGRGRILFVSSAASFGPAPYMSLYYATKAFVTFLVHGYHRELRDERSAVTVSLLCPGPVRTGFEKRANAHFTLPSLTPEKVARYAIPRFLKGRLEIVPGAMMKAAHLVSHFVPKRLITMALNKSAEIQTKEDAA